MKLLYSTNDKIYSKLHRHIMKEPFTHVGLLFFADKLDIVIDCTKPFSKVYHLDHWLTKYKIIETQNLWLTSAKETEYYKKCVDYCLLEPYDWGAYAYAWICAFKYYVAGCKLPETNKWGGSGLWCTEVVYPLMDLLYRDFEIYLHDTDLAAKTPYMLYNIINGCINDKNKKIK